MAFNPPTAEQMEAYLQRHPPRAPSPWVRRAPLMVLAGLLVLVLAVGGLAALVLPWVALVGALVYLVVRTRRAQSLEQRATRVQELAMLRRYPEALRRAWRLVPQVATQTGLYVRTVAAMAHCLDQLRAHDAAITGYDRLLEILPAEHPGAVHLRVQRALSALFAQRLADADEALRRLRNVMGRYARTPIGAAYRLAELTQIVHTHHYGEALREADHLLEELRPLGVHAGYGHALLALCYHEARDDERLALTAEQRQAAAALWWQRATMLLPPAALLARYPELAPLTQRQAPAGTAAREAGTAAHNTADNAAGITAAEDTTEPEGAAVSSTASPPVARKDAG